MSKRKAAGGFSLFETPLALAVASLLTSAVYALLGPSHIASQVHAESQRLAQLRPLVGGIYASAVDFEGLAAVYARAARGETGAIPVAPAGFDATRSPWGTFEVGSTTFDQPNDGWAATYQGVPSAACGRLTVDQLGQWSTISVDGKATTHSDGLRAQCSIDRPAGHVVVFAKQGERRADPLSLSSHE